MKTQTAMTVSAVGVALGLAAPVLAAGDETVAELQARLAEAENRLAQLESERGDAWLTEQRAVEIRALVQDVLADADTRASLLQDGMNAGYNKGFFISSSDGNFSLIMNGQLQFRFVWNNQDDGPVDDDRWGFENRRTKLKFKGHVVDPSWKYTINGGFGRSGGDFVLEDAKITKDFDNGWELTVGQYKPPFMREELVSSSKQEAVDRSLVNEEYNQDRAQGIQIAYEGENVRFAAMYHDGFGMDNTAWSVEDTEFAATGRLEFLGAGNWKQFDDGFVSWRGEEFGAMIGVAGHYQKAEFGTGTGAGLPFSFNDDEVELASVTADLSLEFGGTNLFGAVVYRNIDSDALTADQLGFVVQGGHFFTDEWEGFARYEWSDFDVMGVEDLSVITVGVNRYWKKHDLKWTTDFGYGFNDVSSAFASDGVGWRTDSAGSDGQIVIRSQLQLLF